ncbi:uncharacterized protein LOC134311989 [Trichomycterus rosablanca]|uniref:uncharacterized protein LOC134311989 n=1 Tax=Trichomycterus rosablanca TaxID=2290929 RepID=UPI002F350C88
MQLVPGLPIAIETSGGRRADLKVLVVLRGTGDSECKHSCPVLNMPVCAVLGCARKRELTYRIPLEDLEMCREWLAALKNPDYNENTPADLLKNIRVCSRHFRAEDFKPDLMFALMGTKSRPELKEDAVPSVLLSTVTDEILLSKTPSPCKKARAEENTPRKNYTKEAVACALSELEEGGSYRKVAIKYGIPHTTLRDYKKKRYAHNPHPNRALTPEEEDALVTYIVWMSEHGFPVTGAVVKDLALTVIKSSQRTTLVNLDKGLSSMWWSRFRARHPEITSRTPGTLDQSEVHRPLPQAIDGLFAICKLLYQKHNLEEKPHLIFNCGETAFVDKPGAKEHITVHYCVSAAGESIPPFVIYPRCLPSASYAQDGPTNAIYGVSPKGLMEGELFLEWLDHFIKFAPAERPLLLYLDQNESHVYKEVVDFCSGNGIEVVCLPAHVSHLLQPLDVAVFGALKTAFTAVALRTGGDMVDGKRQFSAILKEAFQEAVTADNIKEGFRITGLFPLSREADNISKAIAVDTGSSSMLCSSFSRDQDQKVLDELPILLTSPERSKQSENSTGAVYYARPVVQAKVNHIKDQDCILNDDSESDILNVSSKNDNPPSASSTYSDTEEKSSPQDDKSLELYHGSSIFKSGEVLVNTQCLMELFRFCSVCLVECCVSIEGHEKLFSVTQACQSCGYHREWSNHPIPADKPTENVHDEDGSEEAEAEDPVNDGSGEEVVSPNNESRNQS